MRSTFAQLIEVIVSRSINLLRYIRLGIVHFIFIGFLLVVLAVIIMGGHSIYEASLQIKAIQLQEEKLVKNNYVLMDLEWSEEFDNYGLRKVYAKKVLEQKDSIDNYPENLIVVEGSKVFCLAPIGEAYVFPSVHRTYVTKDMQINIARKLLEGYSIIVVK